MAKDFSYTIDSDFEHILDESGNRYIALRRIDWGNTGEYKLDLRKYYTTSDGEERMSGGLVLSDNTTNELMLALLQEGYGDDNDLANCIKQHRPGILDSLTNETEDEFYDPQELLA